MVFIPSEFKVSSLHATEKMESVQNFVEVLPKKDDFSQTRLSSRSMPISLKDSSTFLPSSYLVVEEDVADLALYVGGAGHRMPIDHYVPCRLTHGIVREEVAQALDLLNHAPSWRKY